MSPSIFIPITTLTAPKFFATSKDVSIGPVAVMSLTVSQIIKHVQASHHNTWLGPQIATTVAFISVGPPLAFHLNPLTTFHRVSPSSV